MARYRAGVLIGGYAEDEEQRRSSMKAFLSATASGALKSSRWQERVAVGTAPVKPSRVREDAWLHFGDLLQCRHAASDCALAVNLHDREMSTPGEEACAASAVPPPAASPTARTTLLLSKYTPLRPSPLEPQYDGDVLRFGQKVHLLANPMVSGEPLDAAGGSRPLFLASRPLSATCAARGSRRQAVFFTEAPSYTAVWAVAPRDPAERGACEGQPVAAGSAVLLVHCATQKPLCLEAGVSFPTDFGPVEHEVTAHLAAAQGMQQGLEHQAKGDDFRALPKRSLPPNHWALVNGDVVADLPAAEGGPGALAAGGVDCLLEAIAAQLEAAQPGGVSALDRRLVPLCGPAGDLDAADLLLALRMGGAAAVGEGDMCTLLGEYRGTGPGRVAGRLVAAALAQAALRLRERRGVAPLGG
ncbi:MAG: flagellar associated protein [Monoraphidium minutum]|nr:MAG: flagellar associated protein [Monoraphidium minutum]